jgi:Ser/Thr protein kinase RdoA (MazF antagonist)
VIGRNRLTILKIVAIVIVMTGLRHKPKFDAGAAMGIAEQYFGVCAGARELASERDQNFLLTDREGGKFVLKIANALESRDFIEAQNAVFRHLAKRLSFCQPVAQALSGEEILTVQSADGASHLVRMVQYLPGVPLAELRTHTPGLLRDLGGKLGQLARALEDFDHPAVHRDFHWDLANGNRVIDKYGGLIKDLSLRELVFNCRVDLEDDLRRSVIHGDANDYNVLVDPARMEVVGLIDFGDMVYSYTVGELAIAIAYVVLEKDDPVAAAMSVVDGYDKQFPLLQNEREVLWDLVRLRLAMSVCIAANQELQQPENEYLKISQRAIRESLPGLATDLRG